MTDSTTRLIKKLRLPPGFLAPTRLDVRGSPRQGDHARRSPDDVRGINASIALIQTTRGGGWPTEPVTEEFNFVDLVWHELEFREGTSFTYAVYDVDGGYLGCCYLYPMGGRTELSEERLDPRRRRQLVGDSGRLRGGYYEKLYRALRHWLAEDSPSARRTTPTR